MNNQLKKALFLSLFIILPFLFNPFNGDVELIKVIFLSVATLALLIFAIFFIKQKIRSNTVLTALLIGFLLFATISLFSNDLLTSLFGIYGRYMGYIAWLSCIMLVFVTPYYLKDEKFLNLLVKSLIWVGFTSAIIAILLIFFDINVVFEGRLSGLTGNPNVLGKLLLFTIVLNIVYLPFLKGKTQYLYTFTLLSQLTVLMLTGNRASWLALAIVVVILIAKNSKKYLKHALILITLSIPFVYFMFDRLVSSTSIITRLEIYQTAVSKLFERGLFGYGFDFPPTLLIPNESYTFTVDRAHQLFLDIGLNVGIPGLLVFIAISVISIYQLLKDKNYYYKAFGFALLALFISLQFSYFTSITLLFYFLCIGVNFQRSLKK